MKLKKKSSVYLSFLKSFLYILFSNVRKYLNSPNMVAIKISTNWYNGKIINIRKSNRKNGFSKISVILIKFIIGSDKIKVKDPLIPNIMNINIRWFNDLALKYLISLIIIINN